MKQIWKRTSLQLKITILFLFFIILPLLVIGSLSIRKTSDTLTSRIRESNLNTLIQTGNNIDLTFRDITSVSLYLLFNHDVRDFFHLENDSKNYSSTIYHPLSMLFFQKPYFQSVYLETDNGHILDSSGAKNPISEAYYNKADEKHGGHFWFKTKLNYPLEIVDVFSYMRVYNDIYKMNPLGYLKVNISTDFVSETMAKAEVGPGGRCFLSDFSGNILLDTGKESSDSIGNILVDLTENHMIQDYSYGYIDKYNNNKDYLVTWFKLKETDWLLVNLIPRSELLHDNEAIRTYILFVALFCFLILAPLAAFFISSSLKPIHEMTSLMKQLESKNFDVTIDVQGNDEIATLGRSFNLMSARLKTLVEQEYKVRIKLQSAELQALQEQINPHFLYNTLDTICWMCRINDDFESANLIEALSSMFRLSLNNGNKETTVEQELEHLKSYNIIQSKRYENVILFNLEADEDLLDYQTSKIVLQPLVENAIVHGIEPLGRPGRIDVKIYKEDNMLIFEIKDDGIGFDIEVMKGFLEHADDNEGNRGFAVKNVHDRIKLLCGDGFGLEFKLNATSGATVKVKQALIKRRENPNV